MVKYQQTMLRNQRQGQKSVVPLSARLPAPAFAFLGINSLKAMGRFKSLYRRPLTGALSLVLTAVAIPLRAEINPCGRLVCYRGRVQRIAENATGLEVEFAEFRRRESRRLQVNYVVNCTGPECNYHKLDGRDQLSRRRDIAEEGGLFWSNRPGILCRWRSRCRTRSLSQRIHGLVPCCYEGFKPLLDGG